MADYGLYVENTTNNIAQVDSTYMNQAVVYSGTIASIGTYTTPYFGGRVYTLNIPDNVENPSLAIELSKTVWVSKYRFGVTPQGVTQVSIWVSGDPGTLKYFVYGSNRRSNTEYGVLVYNKDGGLVFDSGNKYLKILGVAANRWTSFNPVDSDTSPQYDTVNKKLAILVTGDTTVWKQDVIFGGGTTADPYLVFGVVPYIISADNRVLQTFNYVTSLSGSGGPPDNNVECNIPPALVVDVTNF